MDFVLDLSARVWYTGLNWGRAMPDELEKIVKALPRPGMQAEDIGDFPIEDRAPGKAENARVEIKAEGGLDRAEIESLSGPPDYAKRKRELPPLALTAKPRKGFDLKRDRRWDKRREIAEPEGPGLTQVVKAMPMRWDRRKPKA